MMYADQICAGWLMLGLSGWCISIISDIYLYKTKVISPIWILLGPIVLMMSLKSVLYWTNYKIKKVKRCKRKKEV